MSRAPRPRLPGSIWALGFVSLLMDVSSELIHSLLPVFMVATLGASMVTVGLIEGLAEATALIVKVFSGVLSDWWGRRKPLALLGYGLGAAAKPLFALATGAGSLLAARLIDRVGKGLRGAPRDALIADITTPDMRGAAFGLRQSLDTVGAFLGPLLGIGLMLLWGVREPERAPGAARINPIRREALAQLGRNYWTVVTLGAVFTLARFSEAFLVLRGQQSGLAMAWTPLVLIAMNVVYAALAYPLGALADRMNRRHLLAWGLVTLIAADALLAASGSGWLFWVGIVLWGLHMAMTQGLLAAMVADASPADLRGTAFGVFNLASGVALLVASVLAGVLWDQLGPAATFGAGAAFSALALLGVLGVHTARSRD